MANPLAEANRALDRRPRLGLLPIVVAALALGILIGSLW